MTTRKFGIINGCFGLGSSRPGCVRGPTVVRDSDLLGRLRSSGVDIIEAATLLEAQLKDAPYLPQTTNNNLSDQDIAQIGIRQAGDQSKKYLKEVLDFNERLFQTALLVHRDNRIPIIIGGDHSISVGSFTAALKHSQETRQGEVGLLWVDTHPDINTPETTPSGNLHGMTVAHLLGLGDPSLAKLGDISPKIKPENIIFLGLRWVDPPEVSLIRQLGITAYTMHEIDRYGIGAICEKVFTTLNKLTGFVLSFDLDVCDPAIAPGVGTPVRGGLTFRESHLIMEMAAECPGLTSVDIVEYNPDLDVRGATRELVAGMIESVTGKKILPTVSI